MARASHVDTLTDLTALVKAGVAGQYDALVDQQQVSVAEFGGTPFVWDAASTATVNSPYIVASDEGGDGRWVRRTANLNLMDFGALGDNSADDRDAILAAIDAAFSLGGARIVTEPGKVHRYSGRILLRPGVDIDMGQGAQIAPNPTGTVTGASLVATSTDGGIDLVAGSHIRATLRTSLGDTYVGPMLDVNDAKSTEADFGLDQRGASFDVRIRLSRGQTCTGIRMISSGSSGGVSWVRGVADILEATTSLLMETSGSGYVNENWLDIRASSFVDALKSVNNGNEIAGNRIRITTQTDSTPRAKRAVRWDGERNLIDLFVWDWNEDRIDLSDGGAIVELTADSGGNIINGILSRGSGLPGGLSQMPVIDLCDRSLEKNHVSLRSGRFQESINQVRNCPVSAVEHTFCGDQDNSFAYARTRYTVSTSGTTQPDSTSLTRLFDLSGSPLAVNDCEDFTVNLNLGVTPGQMIGMGIEFIAGNRPDRVFIEHSTNESSWSMVMEAGDDGDIVPVHLFRTGPIANSRYWRMRVENDTPKLVRIHRWWAVDAGFSRLQGAFAPISAPNIVGPINVTSVLTAGQQITMQGLKVIGVQQAAIADAVGSDEVAKINDILAALRAHGLIAT